MKRLALIGVKTQGNRIPTHIGLVSMEVMKEIFSMSACDHLLVDGYNLAHSWPDFRSLFKQGTDAVVARLTEQIRIIHDYENIRTTLVFDGKGTEPVIERPGTSLNLSLVFSPAGTTADTIIEQLVERAADPGKLVVASNDRALGNVVRAIGARVLSGDELLDWLKSVRGRQDESLSRLSRKSGKKWKRSVL